MCTAAIPFTTMLACLDHAVMPGNMPLHLSQASALTSPAGLVTAAAVPFFAPHVTCNVQGMIFPQLPDSLPLRQH